MSKFQSRNLSKYLIACLSLVVVIALFVDIGLNIWAWFTDQQTDYYDARVGAVDIVILQNSTQIGGEVTIEHNDPFTQTDDVYTFTPGTTPTFATPNIGDSIQVNLQVQNLGWAKGLVRLRGFAIGYYETVYTEDTNFVLAKEIELSINNNDEVWVKQNIFDDLGGDFDSNYLPIAYDMYLNRTLAENEIADVVVTLTNIGIDPVTFDKIEIYFRAEITLYESNAYVTGGNYPPFGDINALPTEWTAWQVQA